MLEMQPLSHLNLVDTHCHLNFEVFDNEHSKIIIDAGRFGVKMIINPAVDVVSSQDVVKMADQNQNIFAAIGVHPNETMSWNEDSLIILENLALNKKVVAIGEIGLDYYRDRSPREKQLQVLEKQLDLAAKFNLPVIIHNRAANQDILSILEAWQSSLVAQDSPLAESPGVLHSFSADYETAVRGLDRNFFLGVTGPITFPSARELREIVSEIPLESLLLETDAPFLAPQPRRGKRNEPGFLIFTAQKLSDLKNVPIETVASITTASAKRLFRIGEKTLA